MNRAAVLVVVASLASGVASAQVYDRRGYDPATDDAYRARRGIQVDTARVLRVDPVFEDVNGYPGDRGYGPDPYRERGYADDGYGPEAGSGAAYGGNDPRGYDSHAADRRFGGAYGHDTRCRSVRNDGYVDVAGQPRDGRNAPASPGYGRATGTDTGRTVATVIGGVLGAVVGSQVGGGSGRYATSAIGTMVGGIAGREVYEAGQRTRQEGLVTVCDPVAVGDGREDARGLLPDGGVRAYDVTYEYAGREYVTRTRYHPGDTLRVRVDVTPYD